MKKNSFLFKLNIALICALALFTSCEVGLGSSIDTEVPVIEILNPPSDSIIRDEFAVSGTWHDDGNISSLTVTLKNIDTAVTYGPFTADLTGNDEVLGKDKNGEWSCVINPRAAGSLIPDGNYEVTVSIQDTGEHVTKLNRNYAIDNTPPVVILERPGSKAADTGSVDTYGRRFTLEGMAADDHNVDHIEVLIYKENTFETLLDTVRLNNVPPTINLEVASFVEDTDNAYSRIYGSQKILDNPAVTRYCKIVAYDGAVKYPLDGSAPSEEEKNGNSTEIYYLRDEVSSAGILTDNCKITDIYSILNGSKAAPEDTFLTKLEEYRTTQGAFVINPKNNPTYTASVRKPLKKDGKDFDTEVSSDYVIFEGFPLTIEVIAGLDNYALNASTLRPYAIECDAFGNPLANAQKVYLEGNIQSADVLTSYKWNTIITYKKGLVNGKCYVVGVEGVDEIQNIFIPKDTTGYGFKFDTKAEVNVEIGEISINGGKNLKDEKILYIPSKNPANTNAYTNIVVKGSVYAVSGVPAATIYLDNDEAVVINFTEADEDPAWNPAENNGKYKYLFTRTINAEKFSKKDTSGEYNLKIKAVNGNAENTYQKVALYDCEKPVIGTFELLPTAKKYEPTHEEGPVGTGYLNGEVTVSLDVRDDWSQLDKVNILLQKKTASGAWENVTEFNPTSNFRTLSYKIDTTKPINSKTFADKDKLKVIVTVTDKAGNTEIQEKEYTVDQETDFPVVLPGNCEKTTLRIASAEAIKSNDANPNKKNYIEIGNVLSLNAFDDDGIDTIKVEFISNRNGSEVTKHAQGVTEYQFDVAVPSTAGIYPVKLTIVDINKVERIYNFVVRVVAANPIIDKLEAAKYTTTNTKSEKLDVSVSINSDQPDFILERKVISKTTKEPIEEYSKTYTKAEIADLGTESPIITDSILMSTELENGSYTIYYVVTDNVEHKGDRSIDFYVDNKAPSIDSIVVPSSDESESGSFTFSGKASDGTEEEDFQSGVQKVEYQIVEEGNQPDEEAWKSAGGTDDWLTTIDFSGWKEGKRYFYARAYDKSVKNAGNLSEVKKQEFWYDKSAPSASILKYLDVADAPVELNDGEIETERKFYYGRKFSLTGTAADSNALAEVKLIQVKLQEGGNVTTEIDIPLENITNTQWTISNLPRKHDSTEEFDGTGDVTTDGTYVYSLWVKDVSGKETTSKTQTLYVDRTPPTVTILPIPTLENTTNRVVSGNKYDFKVLPVDEINGSGVVSITCEFFKIDMDTGDESTKIPAETLDAQNNVAVPITKLLGSGGDLEEGKYKLKVTAKDQAANVSASVSAIFFVDQTPPALTADNIQPIGLKAADPGDSSKVCFVMNGTVSDTNRVASVTVKRNDKDNPIYSAGNVSNWSFEEKFNIGTEDGEYEYTITAKDVAGRETVITRKVVIDTNKPVVDTTKIKTPSPAETQNAAFNFVGDEGSVTDVFGKTDTTPGTTSGLTKIDFVYGDSAPAKQEYTVDFSAVPAENGKWNSMQTFKAYNYFYDDTTKQYSEGNKKLWIKAYDQAGNSNDWTSVSFVYDVELPSLTESGLGTDGLYKNSTFTLTGNATDTYGVSDVKITAVKKETLSSKPAEWPGAYYTDELCKISAASEFADGTYYKKVPLNDSEADLSGDDVKNKTWSKKLNLADDSTGDLPDGNYTMVIEVTDLSGKSNTSLRRVNIDTTKPSVKTTEITNADDQKATLDDNSLVYNTKLVKFKATALDSLSGVTSISYCYSNRKTDEVPNPVKSAWQDLSKQGDGSYTGTINFASDGEYWVYFRAIDIAGNIGEKADYIKVKVDSTAPVDVKIYDVASGGTALTGTVLTNGEEKTYYLEATDAYVGVKGFGLGKDVEATATTANAGRYPITIPTESQVTGPLYFTVWDNANNKANYAPINFKLDNTAPVSKLKLPALKDGSSTDTIDVNGNVTISVTVEDGLESPSGNDGKVTSIELWYSVDVDGKEEWFQFDSSDTKTGLTNSKEDITVTHRFSSSTQMLKAVEDGGVKKLLLQDDSTSTIQTAKIKVIAKDEINNVGEQIYNLKVNRNSDRPTVSFNTLTLGSDMSSEKSVWLKGSTKLQGTVSDDDGIEKIENNGTSTIQLFIANKENPADSDWKEVSVNNRGAWTYDIKDFFSGETDPVRAANKSHTLKFKVVDLEGNTFKSNASSALDAIYLTGKDSTNQYGGETKADSQLYLTVDTLNPDINMDGLYIGSDTTLRNDYANITIGGDILTFKAKVRANDGTNGINKVQGEARFNELPPLTVDAERIAYDENTYEGIYEATFTIDLANSPINNNSGNVTIRLTAVDNAGNTSVQSNTIKFDYKRPGVEILKPTGGATSSGSINVYGTVDETVTMLYALSTSDTIKPFATAEEAASRTGIKAWTGKNPDTGAPVNENLLDNYELKPVYKPLIPSLTWFLYLDGQNGENHDAQLNDFLVSSKITTRDAIQETKEFTTIVNVYLWIKATDASGNINEACYPIYVDPQGERPSLSITYPKPSDTKVGSAINVYGIAEPKNTNVMRYVWMQLVSDEHVDSINDSSFTKDGRNFGSPDSASFSITKDDLDYLAAAGYDVYNMKTYRTEQTHTRWTMGASLAEGYLASDYGVLIETEGSTAWSKKINTHGEFDDASKEVKVGMKIYAEDDHGNISLKETRVVSFDAGRPVINNVFYRQYSGSEVTASKECTNSTFIKGDWYLTLQATDDAAITSLKIKNASGVELAAETTGLNTRTANLKYLLQTSGVGEEKYTIEAGDGVNTTTKVITVNYDNQDPQLSNFTHYNKDENGNICQSNGFYKFGGKVTENPVGTANQSGLDFVAFYFKRDDKIFDIMWYKQKEVTVGSNEYVIGEDKLPWKEYTISSADLNSITLSSTPSNVYKGGLVKIKNVIYVISNVTENVITINGNLDENLTYDNDKAAFAMAGVVNNTVTESAYGSKLFDNTAFGNGYYTAPANDDGDRIIESIATDGTWTASINSANMSDGKVELWYVVYDKAGNTSYGKVDKRGNGTDDLWISNNGPRIAGVTFKVDYNGDGDFTENETVTKFNAASKSERAVTGKTTDSNKNIYNPDPERTGLDSLWQALGKKMTLGKSNEGALTLKGKTEVHPEIVGGNGAIYYAYSWKKYDGTSKLSGSNATAIIENGTTDYTVNTLKEPVTIALGDLIQVGEAKTKIQPDQLVLTFYDSTNGSTSLDDKNQKAELEMYVNVNVQATSDPTVTINPFYWNSFADNSIYDSDETTTYENIKGHIELEGDLNFTGNKFTDSSGLMDIDPKVSGEIVIKGTAHDDVRINQLYFSLPGMEDELEKTGDGMAALTPMEVSGVKYYCLADLPDNSTVIQGDNYYEKNGVKLELENTYSENGHDITWALSWNTAKIENMANTDVSVKVIAVNNGTQTQESGGDSGVTGLDGTTKYTYGITENSSSGNTPGDAREAGCYKMDIVPYIRNLKTTLTEYMSNHPSVYGRTALGKYPVYYYTKDAAGIESNDTAGKKKESYEFVGFNISDAVKTVAVGSDTTSGKKTVTVNGVTSLNNENNDQLEYNKQPNGVNNNNLNDDVEIVVWNINARTRTSSLGALTEAKMHVNNNALGYSYIHNGGVTFNLNSVDSDDATSTFENIDFVYDKNGNAFGMYAGTNYNGGDTAGHFKLAYGKWGKPDGDAAQGTTYALESMAYRTNWNDSNSSVSLPKRFAAPKLATSSNTNTLYLLYYDSLYSELKFKVGNGYGNTKGVFGDFRNIRGGNSGANAIGAGIKQTDYNYVSVVANVNTLKNSSGNVISNSSTLSQGVNGQKYGPGKYYSIDVALKDNSKLTTDNEVAVIVWVDEVNNTLWYSYMEDPVGNSHKDSSGTAITNNMPNNRWSTPQAIITGTADGVCAIAVDPDNHIHIAAYSSEATGSLVYAYLDTYNSTVTANNVVYVDRYGTTGEYLTLEVAKSKSGGRYVPYIGYYSNETPKYAYLYDETSAKTGDNWYPKAGVNGNYYTGAWEEILVPTSSPIVANDKNNNINIALNTSSGVIAAITGTGTAAAPAGTSSANPVLGYAISYQGKGYIETAQIK